MGSGLSNAQREILQSFSFELSAAELGELKAVLVQYFSDRIDSEMDALFAREGWSVEEKVAEWGDEHLRTPYNDDLN